MVNIPSVQSIFPVTGAGRAAVRRSCKRLLLVVLLTPALYACAPFAPGARFPQDVAPVADSYSIRGVISEPQQRWWESFGDDDLNGLVQEALASNQSLAVI